MLGICTEVPQQIKLLVTSKGTENSTVHETPSPFGSTVWLDIFVHWMTFHLLIKSPQTHILWCANSNSDGTVQWEISHYSSRLRLKSSRSIGIHAVCEIFQNAFKPVHLSINTCNYTTHPWTVSCWERCALWGGDHRDCLPQIRVTNQKQGALFLYLLLNLWTCVSPSSTEMHTCHGMINLSFSSSIQAPCQTLVPAVEFKEMWCSAVPASCIHVEKQHPLFSFVFFLAYPTLYLNN